MVGSVAKRIQSSSLQHDTQHHHVVLAKLASYEKLLLSAMPVLDRGRFLDVLSIETTASMS